MGAHVLSEDWVRVSYILRSAKMCQCALQRRHWVETIHQHWIQSTNLDLLYADRVGICLYGIYIICMVDTYRIPYIHTVII
jgi:hypothetical protein